MNFLSPWSLLWLLPIGGVIVALYLLKLRRRDEIVSSVLLWQAVVQDTQANAPLQKLRRNLLLLLQLLIALFLVFTLARPFLWATGLGGRATAIVLDGSASMKATDEKPSRFARAVEEAKTLVRRKNPGDQATIVLAGEQPRTLAPLTADGERLLRALDAAEPTDATGDPREAIAFAAAQVASHAGAGVTVISDGAWGGRLDEIDLGGAQLQFLPVGKRAENAGITAFDVRDTLAGNARQVFVTVQNFGKTRRVVPLEVRVGGQLRDAHEIALAPGASKSETFDGVAIGGGGIVEARLDLGDDLAADNAARLVLPPRRSIKILLVSAGNLFLERALNADRRVVLDGVSPGGYKPGTGHDLVVFDGVAPPENLPAGRYLFWGGPARGAQSPAVPTGADADKPELLDWSRAHPLMRFVDLANVHLRRARGIAPAPWAETLAETGDGPLIVAGERGETRAVYVGFSVLDSDMPLRIAFPIFLANCRDWLTARTGEASGALRAGEVVPLAATGANVGPISIARPDGKTDTLRPGGNGPVLYNGANTVGLYTATNNAAFRQTFAVSLLSAAESNITPVATPTILVADAGGEEKERAPLSVPVRREIWPWIAAVALAVLALEWLVYHRRL